MKTKKKIIIIVAIIAAILIGAFAAVYFLTDIFKTPEQLFYKYLGNITKSESDYSYQDMLKDLETANTKSYNSNSTIGVEINAKGSSYSSRKDQQTYNEINKIKIDLQQKALPKDKKEYYNLGIKYDNKDITNIELVKNGDLYGVKSEFLDDKYIALENNNLKEFFENLGLDTSAIPDKIELTDLYNLLYISKDDQDKIVKTYQEVIKKNIPSDKYKKVENVIQKVNGVDTNTTVYALGLNEKEFLKVIIQTLQTLKQDELTQNLIINKVNSIMDGPLMTTGISSYQSTISKARMYGSSSSLTKSTNSNVKTEITKDDLIEGLEDLIEELNEQMEDADDTAVIELVVYVADDKTVRVELKAEEQVQMAIDSYKDNDINHLELLVNQSSYKSDLEKILGVEYKTTKNGDTDNTEGKVTFYSTYDDELEIKFNVTTKGTVGNGINENSYKFEVTNDEATISLNIDSRVEYTDNVQIEDLNDKNSTILNNMNKEEIIKFFNTVGTNFEKQLENKGKDLGLTTINNTTNKTTNSIITRNNTNNTTNSSSSSILDRAEKVKTESENAYSSEMLKLDEAEKQIFNAGFKIYEGEQVSGTNVKSLVSLIITNNSTNNEHKIETSGDIKITNNKVPNINATKKYSVKCKYDSNGYINDIEIKEK